MSESYVRFTRIQGFCLSTCCYSFTPNNAIIYGITCHSYGIDTFRYNDVSFVWYTTNFIDGSMHSCSETKHALQNFSPFSPANGSQFANQNHSCLTQTRARRFWFRPVSIDVACYDNVPKFAPNYICLMSLLNYGTTQYWFFRPNTSMHSHDTVALALEFTLGECGVRCNSTYWAQHIS